MEDCWGRDQCQVNLMDVIRMLGQSQVASTTHDGRARTLGSWREPSGGGAPSPEMGKVKVHAIHPVEFALSVAIRDLCKIL